MTSPAASAQSPVIAGLGSAGAIPDAGPGDLDWRDRPDAVDLMVEAVSAAFADTGSSGVAEMVDLVVVPHGSWDYRNAPAMVAQRAGFPQARTVIGQLGVLQSSLVAMAVDAVVAGQARVAVVVGGEARFRSLCAKAAGEVAVDSPTPDSVGDVDLSIASADVPIHQIEIEHRFFDAVEQYAMVENARRAANGWSLEAHRRELAELSLSMRRVAGENPEAWFAGPNGTTAALLPDDETFYRNPSADNRPLATPYLKWHSTQWTVDQSAALVICTEATARELGVERESALAIASVANSDTVVPLCERRNIAEAPGSRLSARAALDRAGVTVEELSVVDLYSCFPAAVWIQQHEIGLPADLAPTITGGMAFAGGPFNNYVLQSLVSVGRRLRAQPGSGLVTAFSGMVTKQGAVVLRNAGVGPESEPGNEGGPGSADSSSPSPVVDVTEEVAAATPRTTAVGDHTGGGVIASYTVRHLKGEPVAAVVLADLPDGTRALATSDSPELAAQMADDEWVGVPVALVAGSFTLA